MAFEEFRRTVTRVQGPAISIPRTGGRVNPNSLLARELHARGFDALRIFFDPTNCAIAIKPATKEDATAFPLLAPPDKSLSRWTSTSFMARPFLDRVGWQASSRVIIPLSWSEEREWYEGVLPEENVTAAALKSQA